MTTDPPFGYFRPRGWAYLAFGLIRLGLGRGDLRRLIRRIWHLGHFGRVADVCKWGIQWRLDFSNNYPDEKLLFSSKGYDRVEIAALAKASAGGGCFVDIGANTGYYSLRLARYAARVLALEPNPEAYRRLAFNIALNDFAGHVIAVPLGVGAPGEQVLTFDDLGGGSLVAPAGQAHRVRVQTLPLADILAEQHIGPIAALKIDVEGAEDAALIPFFESAPRAAWPRCLVMEVAHRRRWQRDVRQFLHECGYRPIVPERTNAVLQLG